MVSRVHKDLARTYRENALRKRGGKPATWSETGQWNGKGGGGKKAVVRWLPGSGVRLSHPYKP